MHHATHGTTTSDTQPMRRCGRAARAVVALSLACVCGAVAWPAFTVAEDAATPPAAAQAPSGGRDGRDRDGRENRDDRGGRDYRGRWGPRTPTTQQGNDAAQPEYPWSEVAAFMGVHSPQKWKMFETMRDGQWKQNAQKGIAARFADLQRMKAQDPDAYKLEVERVVIEDGIFGAMAAYRTANNDELKQKARQDMRARVEELATNRQAERELRAARLAAEVESLKAEAEKRSAELEKVKTEIAEGSANREEYVTKRTDQFLNQGFGGPRGHRRGPGDRPTGGDRPERGERRGEPETKPAE